MEAPKKCIMRHGSAGKGDEDHRLGWLPKQANVREGCMLRAFSADAIVRRAKHDIRAVESCPLLCSSCAALDAGRHWVAMKEHAIRPDHRPLKCCDCCVLKARHDRRGFARQPAATPLGLATPNAAHPVVHRHPASSTMRRRASDR